MSRAVLVSAYGGPEVLQISDVDPGHPGEGQALIRQTAIGINYIDVYHRTGIYPAASLPFTPGSEGAGVVMETGAGVAYVKPGDRVAYAGASGAYAETRLVAADRLVKLPDTVSDQIAAASMLKGMTAHYLLRRTHRVRPGDVILFHAAAGGVGLIAGQWAKSLGATVIGTAGSPEKAALALANGYDHVINYRTENFAERVREITDGRMCDVVYDSVGKDTFPASLDCIRPLGMFVSFGQSSGLVPPFNLGLLAQKGSLFVTRPVLHAYIAKRSDLEATAEELFGVIGSGTVNIKIHKAYRFDDVAQAHRDLEGRQTTGASILVTG